MFGEKKNGKQPDFEYFTIYDSKVGVYREPVLAVNKFDLLRTLESYMRNPANQQNQLYTNAEDFSAFKIGEYDKATGKITPCNHEHVANLHEIRTIVQRVATVHEVDQIRNERVTQ